MKQNKKHTTIHFTILPSTYLERGYHERIMRTIKIFCMLRWPKLTLKACGIKLFTKSKKKERKRGILGY